MNEISRKSVTMVGIFRQYLVSRFCDLIGCSCKRHSEHHGNETAAGFGAQP